MTIAPILYTQAGCAESAQVRTWLTGQGIAFTEYDVTGDLTAARALAASGVFATPLLVFGETKVLGFRPRVLAAIVGDWRDASAARGPDV
jgi:glutaredoxin